MNSLLPRQNTLSPITTTTSGFTTPSPTSSQHTVGTDDPLNKGFMLSPNMSPIDSSCFENGSKLFPQQYSPKGDAPITGGEKQCALLENCKTFLAASRESSSPPPCHPKHPFVLPPLRSNIYNKKPLNSLKPLPLSSRNLNQLQK